MDLYITCIDDISTHGPARGPTVKDWVSFCEVYDFNSRPREGADVVTERVPATAVKISTHGPARGPTKGYTGWYPGRPISTHGPARGPTEVCLIFVCVQLFQLTAPRGGRPQPGRTGRDAVAISTHGPARGPTQMRLSDTINLIFQLTAPRGGRQQF